MHPGMTQAQYAEAREMMEQLEDCEFYEAMGDDYGPLVVAFLAKAGPDILFEFGDTEVDNWRDIGGKFERKFFDYAVKELREKYRTSGDLLECVRVAVMGEAAQV